MTACRVALGGAWNTQSESASHHSPLERFMVEYGIVQTSHLSPNTVRFAMESTTVLQIIKLFAEGDTLQNDSKMLIHRLFNLGVGGT
jgi:hypothetical protein